MSIKYYQLAKDEELPDEFCAVRDVGGEPSEYTFYVPEAENAKLRELCADMGMCLTWQWEPHGYMMDGCDHCRFKGKTGGMCGLGMFRGRMRELGVEVG